MARRMLRWIVAITIGLLAVAGSLMPSARVADAAPPAAPAGRQYYLDSRNGSDDNPGTSAALPWRSLARLDELALAPGDTVNLAAGSEWQGPLVIAASGTAEAPITLQAYGKGVRPAIYNPAYWGVAVDVRGSYVNVDGLAVRDTHYIGVRLGQGTGYSTVRNCEAVRVGIAFGIYGDHHLVTQNYAHDLTIVISTPGGDDDFGGIGVVIHGSDNEVSYNLLVRCAAPSQDYGVDGGGIEWFGTADNAYVHHNWVADSAGFLEVGGGSAQGAVVAYNVSVGNGLVAYFHLGGGYAADVRGFRFENNTVVDTGGQGRPLVFGFRGQPQADTLIVRNNIFYVRSFRAVALTGGFTHDHNLYWLGDGGASLGFAAGESETVADPLFADVDERDFRLQRSSPARGKGADLGHRVDFSGRQLLRSVPPDLGAYQYNSRLAQICPLLPRTAALLCQARLGGVDLRLGLRPPTAGAVLVGASDSTRRRGGAVAPA
ncbi:MAG: hypothetical protein ACYC5O_22380 [Anaerolineae bacterium]